MTKNLRSTTLHSARAAKRVLSDATIALEVSTAALDALLVVTDDHTAPEVVIALDASIEARRAYDMASYNFDLAGDALAVLDSEGVSA